MKKLMIAFLLMLTMTAQADNVMTKTQDGTYIVNTTTLADDVEGYAGREGCRAEKHGRT